MDMEVIIGVMVEYMMEIGKITKWKEMEFLPGQMEGYIRVNILMIRKKGKEYSLGQMAGNMKDSGRMGDSMV